MKERARTDATAAAIKPFFFVIGLFIYLLLII
jgi:hypothetical protein